MGKSNSRADENYFGGSMKYIEVGNTEKAAKMIAEMTGADLFKIEQRVPYAAVYTFLESFDFTGKKIYPFCTHEGSGLSGTEQDIRKSAKGAVVGGGLAIHGSSADSAKQTLQKWIEEGC